MSFLKSIFSAQPDPRESMRPLWERVIEISREKPWFAQHGIEDNVGGRFDMITAVIALVMIRLESEERFGQEIAWLTELFVEDMDGQLRELGINDVVVGKHMGKLMATLGGRIGALRDGLASENNTALAGVVSRNMQLVEGTDPENTGAALRALYTDLRTIAADDLIAGSITR